MAASLGDLAFAASPDGIVVLDRDGLILDANPAARRLLASVAGGASSEDLRLVGSSLAGMLGVEGPLRDRLVHLPDVGVGPELLELRTAPATPPTPEPEGEPSVTIVTLRTTAATVADDPVDRADEKSRLLAIVDATPSAVAMYDPDERITFLNAAGRRMLGLGPSDTLAGLTMADFHPPEVYRSLHAEALPAARERGVWSAETVLVTREGREIPVWQSILGHRASDGRLLYYSAVARDLSGWKETEEALVERVKELRTLYRTSRELSRTSLSLAERLDRIANLLPQGWLYPDLTEARIAWGDASASTPGFRETPWSLSSGVRLQGEVIGKVEVVLTEERPDRTGGEGPFLREERELLDAVAAAVGEAIERDRLQNEFIQGQKLETIGRLAGGVAHDFNNLLMVIRGHAEIGLETVPAGTPLADDLGRILDASRRGGDLTRQLLAFSRRQSLEERHLDLREQLGTLEPMLRSLVPERIELQLDTEGERGPVRADPVKLDQVILNLVVNAVDAIETRGTIDIRLGSRTIGRREAAAIPWRFRAGPYVKLTIRDTGCGMSPKVLNRIFEPFFTTKPEGKGTGLGLSVVFGSVKQSGGHVFVDSVPGEGTTIEILLPRVEAAAGDPPESGDEGAAEEPAAPAASRRPSLPREEEGQDAAMAVGSDVAPRAGRSARAAPGRAILLVDDDHSVRDVMGRILEREGHRVVLATDGREALAILAERDREIELVVSDVVMPEMDGVEFVDRLRRLRPGLQVVLMSGYVEKELSHGIRERVAGFLEKPFSPGEVAAVIRRALG